MATTDRITGKTGDERAWDVFFEALDPDSATAAAIPSGAAIVPADADNLEELKRRYRAEGRPVAMVAADGGVTIVRDHSRDLSWLLLFGGIIAAAWQRLRSSARVGA